MSAAFVALRLVDGRAAWIAPGLVAAVLPLSDKAGGPLVGLCAVLLPGGVQVQVKGSCDDVATALHKATVAAMLAFNRDAAAAIGDSVRGADDEGPPYGDERRRS